MKIDINCKGTKLTDAIRNHVEDKLSKLERFHRGELSIMVVLSIGSNNRDHEAEVNFTVMGQNVVAKAQADDLYRAINMVADQTIQQVLRLKEKKRSRKKGAETVRRDVEPAIPTAEVEVDLEDDFYEDEEIAAAATENAD